MPVTLEKVRVFYRLGDAGLTLQSARVTIEPAVPVNAPAADLGITTRRVPLVLNVAGYLEAWVVRSNDPALSGPMPYRLVVDAPEHYRTSVIEIVGETDLADVAPVSEPVSVNPVYLLAAALGVTVAPLVAGLVPAVHLPPESGGATAQIQLTVNAAVPLSGHRVVTPGPDDTLDYASNVVAAHLHAPLWITQGAVTAGQPATVLAYGALTESSWVWIPGVPLFLGADGLLTQTPPVAPGALFSAQVGTATSPTSAFFDRQPSIGLI